MNCFSPQCVRSNLRTTVKRARQYLEKLGHVKTVRTRDRSVREASQGRERYYLKLITPLVLETCQEYDEDEEQDDDDDDIGECKMMLWSCILTYNELLLVHITDFIIL